MKTRFLLILCLFFVVSGLAQQRYLRGQIIADSIQYYQVNIVNITQETGTLTSKNGTFKLAAFNEIEQKAEAYKLIKFKK